MKYDCPVCGYPDLSRPPQDDLICACCGTHFGYHDYGTTYEELRAQWIANGARWSVRSIPSPAGWDALCQLSTARMLLVEKGHSATSETSQTDLSSNQTGAAWQLAAAAG